MKGKRYCKNCGDYVPHPYSSKTLETGFCLDCERLPEPKTWVTAEWGMFGNVQVYVTRITRAKNFYAKRWNKKRGWFTSERLMKVRTGYNMYTGKEYFVYYKA